tara:strand:+ start:33135 stop:33764 length:630 start_codon:yes stop_codon:yes gene_type:complete
MPLRSYDEHEVVHGLFSSTAVNSDHLTDGDGDAGVFVKVASGDLNKEPVEYVAHSHLGKVDYPNVGFNKVPTVPNKVAAADNASRAIGLTLSQTAAADENGEKFYYNPRKADSNGIVPSGHAVPVLVRGQVVLTEKAFDGSIPAPGSDLVIGATAGKVSGVSALGATTGQQCVGTVLGTGSRVAGSSADRYVGAAGVTGTYALVYINCV